MQEPKLYCCRTCYEEKPASCFFRDSRRKQGIRVRECKDCAQEAHAADRSIKNKTLLDTFAAQSLKHWISRA